jgi:RimJ/RimL family protein N-acetyltransferase
VAAAALHDEETGRMATDAFPSLRTPRLCLRRFRDSDAAPFARYRSAPEVARYQGWTAPYSVDDARKFVTAMATAEPGVPGEWFQIAVALAGDSSLVGDCAFAPLAHEPRTVEIGFTIAPDHQGQGYATEAVLALLRYLLGTLEKHRVTASCDPRNVPSRKVLEAVGMRQEGHLIESTWSKGEWTDDLVFALLRREWRT